VLGKFAGLLALLSLVILTAVAMMVLLALGTRADVGLILCNLLGLWLLAAAYAALGLYFSAISRQPVVAAFTALAVSVALWLLDMAGGLLRTLSPNTHFQNLNSGLLSSADIAYFVLFISFFLLLTIHHLRRERGGH
jgi:ABC-2 type transport system permease protein